MAEMAGPVLSDLGHSQLKDRVYHYLRDAIISGTFEVGAALRENDITARLGVSKTPVREAFVRLEKDRLLVLVPYKGAVVAGYSTEDLRAFYEVRELLEGACARMAAETVTDRLSGDLQRNVASSAEASDAEKFDAVVRLFDEFDQIIYRQSTNRWISELVENLDGHQRRIGRLTLEIPGRIARSIKQHRAIASAISKGDGDAAERHMRAHVHSVMTDQLTATTSSGPGHQ